MKTSLTVILVSLILFSCSTVHKVSELKKLDSTSVKVIDSIHVKKYDTSVITHELNEYQTKTIEIFDTVRTIKDSIITVLKTRTIWTNSVQNKTELKAGTGIDSAVNKVSVETKLSKIDKSSEKQSSRFPWWLLVVGLGLAVIILLLLRKMS